MDMPESIDLEIARLLKLNAFFLVTAESCTGGLIGDRISNLPGSSDYYLGGVITYSNAAKTALLSVEEAVLQEFGAVSQPTVLAMARGVRQLFALPAQGRPLIGLSTSGIAGPGGGTFEKPVGLAWIGLSTPTGDHAWEIRLSGSRMENKAGTVQQALEKLLEYLSKDVAPQILRVLTRPDEKNKEIPYRLIWADHWEDILDVGRRWRDERGEHWLVITSRSHTGRLSRLASGSWEFHLIAPPRQTA